MRVLILLIIFSGFLSTAYSQMILSGDATGSCDCYELTDNTNEAGSVWSPATIDLSNPFDFTFSVNLGVDDVWGADGMMFALRQSGTSTGALGNGMGYGGIPNSVGIEIDTWNSSPTVATDIDPDHLGMNSVGGVEHDLIAPVAIANIEDGLYHDFRITWDPVSFDLEVFIDGTSIFIYNGDMVTLFFGGNPNVYFGWTGGTGGVDNVQSVCMYRDANFDNDLATACAGQEINFTNLSTGDLVYNGDEAVTYSWDFGDGATSTDENPTHIYGAAGVYTVSLTITDVSGCTSTHTTTINITSGLTVDMSHTDVTCFGLDDGTGTATPTTGTGPYDYNWDDPLSQTTATSTGLSPSTYTVTVTDALGCVGTGSVTIAEPAAIVIDDITTTNASCGMDNGSITITASGGTPALSYSIDGGVSFSASNVFTGLSNGSYTVVVRDANGCEETTTATVALDSPLSIDDITTTDVSCGPTDDGTITITASSGATPYQYSIDGGATYQLSNYFDFLAAGTYTVTVLDASGCDVSEVVTVNSASSVVFDAVTVTNTTCFGGADGEINITASGGTPPYQYSIDGGVTYFPTGDFTGLSAGTYTLNIIDDAGCEATQTVNVNEPAEISIDAISTTNISCAGLTDGAFELTVSGGAPGYTYSNDGGASFQVSPIFTGLSAATYNLVIEDANGCTTTGTTTITEPDALSIDDVIVTDVTCNGLMDGEITVDASGGTTPYQYRVDAGTYQVSPTFTGLGGGDITVEVMDDNGCTTMVDAFLGEADPLILTLGPDTTICLGGEATLCPTVSGGTMPYTYIWDGVADTECLVTSTLGDHVLQVEDVNGCTSEMDTVNVDQYLPLSVVSSDDVTICPGDEVVLAGDAEGDGPTSIMYTWTNDIDGASLDGAVQTVTPFTTTIYTLTVSTGCENTATSTVTITTYPIPDMLIDADLREGCEDLKVNFNSLADPTLVNSLSWNFGEGITGVDEVAISHLYTDPDCYDVTLNVETIDGCNVSETFNDYICVWAQPVADFYYTPDQPDLFNRTVDFYNESVNATDYIWSFGDGSGSTDINPSYTYDEVGNATYKVTLEAYSDQGCADTTYQYITVDELVLYYVPNAFTPNSDPFNQTFQPVFTPGFYPNDYHIIIFNRWGEVVWESYDYTKGWDGSYDGVFADDGVYTWKITFRENKTDIKYQDFGHVTILK